MIAKSGDDDYGVLSIMIEFYGQASITRIVSRKMFYPQPNVDSAIVHLQIEQNKYPNIDKDKFYKFIQTCFSMRRKTLRNNLSHGYGFSSNMLEEKLGKEILEKRAENFDIDQLINIFKNLLKNIKIKAKLNLFVVICIFICYNVNDNNDYFDLGGMIGNYFFNEFRFLAMPCHNSRYYT